MISILGISAFHHDSAAALVVDGEIIAAAQEERFSRLKHDYRFPAGAVEYCLAEAGCTPADLDHVAVYDLPPQTPEAPHDFAEAAGRFGKQYAGEYIFCGHHDAQAASAFYPSPFRRAAILTLDGAGEQRAGAYGVGCDNRIELIHRMDFPHSLGLLYSAFTSFVGFRVNGGEYKVMGLAPYGEPRYADLIREKLIDIQADGSFRLEMQYFSFRDGRAATTEKFAELFAGPPRQPETPITARDMDLAASVQHVTEEVIVKLARHVLAETDMTHLCLAGGMALNCVANGRIFREGLAERLWIQPAAGDAGGALGAAMWVWHECLGHPRHADGEHDLQRGSLLGPACRAEDIRSVLDEAGAVYDEFTDENELLAVVAEDIAAGGVVGHFAGHAEFGPRALGNRSILGDARRETMQAVMNRKIKFRENFRPFAPSVLREHAHEWFDMPPGCDSPYMLLVVPVAESRRTAQAEPADARDIEALLRVVRSDIPAVTHVDGSARVQTVDPQRHGRFYRLLRRFHGITGVPVVVNTSFNVRGEPIVSSPADAYRCFMATDMDVLILESFRLVKDRQPPAHRQP